jgi:hypothetical protein
VRHDTLSSSRTTSLTTAKEPLVVRDRFRGRGELADDREHADALVEHCDDLGAVEPLLGAKLSSRSPRARIARAYRT